VFVEDERVRAEHEDSGKQRVDTATMRPARDRRHGDHRRYLRSRILQPPTPLYHIITDRVSGGKVRLMQSVVSVRPL